MVQATQTQDDPLVILPASSPSRRGKLARRIGSWKTTRFANVKGDVAHDQQPVHEIFYNVEVDTRHIWDDQACKEVEPRDMATTKDSALTLLSQQWTLLHSQSSKALAQTQSSTRDMLAQTQSSAGDLLTSLTPAPADIILPDLALPDAQTLYNDTVAMGSYLEQVSCQVLSHELCQGQEELVVEDETKEADEVVEETSMVTTTVITLTNATKAVPFEDFQFDPVPLLIQESLFDVDDDSLEEALAKVSTAQQQGQGMEMVMALPEI
jgi:hypothetical protein